ncbi:hypothetical protein GmHk_13G039165 [Glycine max]|nr:hypothetical protein GmHk_13G039165 [Glycine max]
MRMLRWMCGKTRQDKIRNGVIRERVGVAPIVEKMVENRLRWFGHIERRLVDSVVRRVDQMERRQTIRGRGRPKKTIREVIKKDLELNDLDRIFKISIRCANFGTQSRTLNNISMSSVSCDTWVYECDARIFNLWTSYVPSFQMYRRLILANGVEGVEGFRQRWSLHGRLTDSKCVIHRSWNFSF